MASALHVAIDLLQSILELGGARVPIRSRVKAWCVAQNLDIKGDLRTSKYYPAEQSRSGGPAWWVEIPLGKVTSVFQFDVFLERSLEKDDFHHLNIPALFFKKNGANFCVTNGKISLWLSAEHRNLFKDVHPKGKNLDFSHFRQI